MTAMPELQLKLFIHFTSSHSNCICLFGCNVVVVVGGGGGGVVIVVVGSFAKILKTNLMSLVSRKTA